MRDFTDVYDTCRDILLDLSDDGFDVSVFDLVTGYVVVTIKRTKKFTFKDIGETVLRLKTFLGQEGFKHIDDLHGYSRSIKDISSLSSRTNSRLRVDAPGMWIDHVGFEYEIQFKINKINEDDRKTEYMLGN
jgi:hypothetical protein